MNRHRFEKMSSEEKKYFVEKNYEKFLQEKYTNMKSKE